MLGPLRMIRSSGSHNRSIPSKPNADSQVTGRSSSLPGATPHAVPRAWLPQPLRNGVLLTVRMLRPLTLTVLFGLLLGLVGCARWECNLRREAWEAEMRSVAEVACRSRLGGSFGASASQQDYRSGWMEGYYHVLRGGDGTPPVVPTSDYWDPKFRQADQACKVQAWRAGFVDGAAEAIACGHQGYGTVPGDFPQRPLDAFERIYTTDCHLQPPRAQARGSAMELGTAAPTIDLPPLPTPLPPTLEQLGGDEPSWKPSPAGPAPQSASGTELRRRDPEAEPEPVERPRAPAAEDAWESSPSDRAEPGAEEDLLLPPASGDAEDLLLLEDDLASGAPADLEAAFAGLAVAQQRMTAAIQPTNTRLEAPQAARRATRPRSPAALERTSAAHPVSQRVNTARHSDRSLDQPPVQPPVRTAGVPIHSPFSRR